MKDLDKKCQKSIIRYMMKRAKAMKIPTRTRSEIRQLNVLREIEIERRMNNNGH